MNLFANSAHNFRAFYTDWQNWFDCVIVIMSATSLYLETVGQASPPIKQIRIIKVTKIFRYIKGLATLNRLVSSIGYCIVPMSMASCILLVVTLIHTVLAVSFFGEAAPQYFSDLKTALLAMTRVSTGDYTQVYELFDTRQVECNRRKSLGPGDESDGTEEFLANVEREKHAAEIEEEALLAKQRVTGVLDPVTQSLTSFQNAQDLSAKIDKIFEKLDADGGCSLTFVEFKQGLQLLPGTAKIHMTADDFEIITENGKHLGEEGDFNKDQFHGMMNTELNRFVFRGLCNALKESDNEEFKQLTLMLKMVEKNIQTSISEAKALHKDDRPAPLSPSKFFVGGSGADYSGEGSHVACDVDLRKEIQTVRRTQAKQEQTLSLILESLRSVHVQSDSDVRYTSKGPINIVCSSEGDGLDLVLPMPLKRAFSNLNQFLLVRNMPDRVVKDSED